MKLIIEYLALSALAGCALLAVLSAVVRLPISARVKVWLCRLATFKLALGSGFACFSISLPTLSGQRVLVQDNSRLTLLCAVLAGIWLMGVVIALVQLGLGGLALHREERSSTLADPDTALRVKRIARVMGIKRMPRILHGRPESSPHIRFAFAPSLVLPRGEPIKDSVIAHELAHIRAADGAWCAVAHFVSVAYWFLPQSWWLIRELGLWQEVVADQVAIDSSGCSTAEHAREVLGSFHRVTQPIGTLALSGDAKWMKRRIQAISGVSTSKGLQLVALTVVVGVMLVQVHATGKPTAAPNRAEFARTVTVPPIAGLAR